MSGIRLFRTVQVKLIIIYVLLILIAMQLIGVYFISTVKNSLTESFTSNLKDQANLLSEMAAPMLAGRTVEPEGEPSDSAEGISNVVRNLFSISEAEIQVLDSSGKVIATSVASNQSIVGKKNPSLLVTRALQSIRDNEEEIIDEDNIRKKIIAQPVTYEGGRVVGAVYIVASMNDLYATMDRVNRIFVSGTLIALGLTGVLGILLAHTITSPIKVLTRSAAAVAEGRFDQQVPVLGDDEIGRLSEAFNDMTSRLSEALSVNEEERDKLASVLANMSDGVVATDQSGYVIVSNRRAQELLDVRECVGSRLSELLELPPEEITGLQLEGGSKLLRKETEEGEWLLRVTFTPVHRRDTGTTSTIAILEDVTEQEKLEQSRREFVANVSHELRTPLTTIKSYAEALDDGALEERQLAERFVNVIRNETERMIRLVTDLLHLSRFDSNQAPLRRTYTSLPELLEEAADRFAFQMNQKGIESEVIIEDGVNTVWIDRDGIDQVLDNLLSNAIKYTQGGGRIVLTACKPDPHMVAVSVKDAGIGIPKKDLGRIFDRFYRVDKARSRSMGGTGLGLSIAREIVRAHGGTISLESELNVGTTVTFVLPAKEASLHD
ncbi:cell wall metabolism sensor histidine kinase WalK [Paenibacillus xylaniclasticus]|uniref:cell wall metabolism sensor histidine kinase WalK n=1 Tax=Paenibacillus xylaniclasticus TaxID=588083 RepID=UPI000FD8C6E3|nr:MULTISPECIES: cell wall metabolism sensor histidine kinase WalK [Paenibacillus]GFN31331.1 sensor histidine kinase WalK [Paenibacillus curdlanolyticus]